MRSVRRERALKEFIKHQVKTIILYKWKLLKITVCSKIEKNNTLTNVSFPKELKGGWSKDYAKG